MIDRRQALDQVVELARSHALDIEDIRAGLARTDSAAASPDESLLGRILGVLGGIFIFAGIGVLIALNWDAMNTAARIIVTLGSGLAAFTLAVLASGAGHGERFSTPLFLIAAALQPTGILVAFDELSRGGDWHTAVLVTAGVMVLQQGLVFTQKKEPALLFTTIAFALWFLATALDLAQADEDFVALLLGASTIGLCTALHAGRWRGVTPFWFLAGAVAFFAGLFSLLRDTPVELLFMAVACGGVYLSIVVRSRTMLAVSTLAMLSYISYFTSRHFLDSLGWPLLLIVLGLLLVGLSAGAVRINRRYMRED